MEKELEIVLKKMFEIAGYEFDISKDEWYFQKWTHQQSDEFETWVKNHLKNNIKPRKALMKFPNKSKKAINGWFMWFNLMYGFTIN